MLALVIAVLVSPPTSIEVNQQVDCPWGMICSVEPSPGDGDDPEDNNRVDVWGEVPTPGGGAGGGGDGGSNEGGDGGASQPPDFLRPPCDGLDDLSPIFTCVPPGEPIEIVTYPPVYASDLISFVPQVPTFASEPAGAGLIGKATNFVASAEEHYLTGTLLGYGVAVAFVPTDFSFDYGDGTTLDSVSGGTLWSDTGSPQFTATDTSHAYATRGAYTATVTVHYDAYVNFGTDTWYSVIGQVHSTSPGFPIRIYEPSTGLVNATCEENPQGPGC